MNDFVYKHKHGVLTSVCLNIESDEVMAIGAKMHAINEEAYMNGYNWEAFLNTYLEMNYPSLLRGLETDSEAGMYVALYDENVNEDEDENDEETDKADKLMEVIKGLIRNPETIYDFLKENEEEFEWD